MTTSCVVGGGLLGMRVAQLLARRAGPGDTVTIVEAAPVLGGLADAWSLHLADGTSVAWDRHYHVTLMSDTHTRGLYDELGLADETVYAAAQAGVYAGGRLVPCSTPVDYAKLPFLGVVAKGRIALTILAGALRRDGTPLEHVPIETWLRRWSGNQATEALWLPLLRAKLGTNAGLASASFIHATIQRLFRARRAGVTADLFGYVQGGYATTLAAYVKLLGELGVRIVVASPVAAIRGTDAGPTVELADGTTETYDRVVVTAAAPLAARLVQGLTPVETRRLNGVTYQGIVCASLVLKRPLSPYYLTYITDDAPFTAVVEMTSLVDPAQLGGHTLVYLPRYVPSDDPWLEKSDSEVLAQFLPALRAMHPSVTEDDVLAAKVSRVRQVMPVPTLGYSDRLPPVVTSVPGVSLISSAHLVNATLNVDETLALADRLLPEVPRVMKVAPMSILSPGRPTASLSLDLDNLWSYKKTHGDADWVDLPSYLPVVVPRLVELFGAAGVTATVFVVGQDADRDRDDGVLQAIPAAGHEIGNHSFSHEPWLHLYEHAKLVEELERTEDALVATTGIRPTGFRGPGYSLSEPLLRELVKRGYAYDASTLPTWLGPLARAYYFRSAGLTAEQRQQRAALFGSARDGLRPLVPYTWDLGIDGRLLEIPVTTAPLARVPFHMSYVLQMHQISPKVAWAWFDAATRLCRRTGLGPSILLHPLDLLGPDDAPGLEFFPGMALPASAKLAVVGKALALLKERFDLVPVGEHARRLAAGTVGTAAKRLRLPEHVAPQP